MLPYSDVAPGQRWPRNDRPVRIPANQNGVPQSARANQHCPTASIMSCQAVKKGVAAMDDIDLDELILSFADEDWQKTIDIIERTLRACAADGLDPGARAIGNRMAALVEDGQLEATGDVFDWRQGTVRLPHASS